MRTAIVEIAGTFAILVGCGLGIGAAALVSVALALVVAAVLLIFAGVVAIYIVNVRADAAAKAGSERMVNTREAL